MNPPAIRTQSSAGGVIFRKKSGKGEPEVALISVKGGTVWTLPKGLIGNRESPEEAAVREVAEETGLRGEIVEKIGNIQYWYFSAEENTRFKKTVTFYLIKYITGSTAEHDFEVEASEWFPLTEAKKKIIYKGDKEILEKAGLMLEKTGD